MQVEVMKVEENHGKVEAMVAKMNVAGVVHVVLVAVKSVVRVRVMVD